MAVSKELMTTTLSIEVESGVDNKGNISYKKKNFSGIKGDATPEALATVADAIKLVLANQTRYTLVNEISMLEEPWNTHYKWSFYVRVVKRVQLQFLM